MFQAITTKYFGPSNARGSRIKAKAAAGSIMVSYSYSLNPEQNHAAAAQALALKFGWGGDWYAGGMPEENGNVYVCISVKHPEAPAFTTPQKA